MQRFLGVLGVRRGQKLEGERHLEWRLLVPVRDSGRSPCPYPCPCHRRGRLFFYGHPDLRAILSCILPCPYSLVCPVHSPYLCPLLSVGHPCPYTHPYLYLFHQEAGLGAGCETCCLVSEAGVARGRMGSGPCLGVFRHGRRAIYLCLWKTCFWTFPEWYMESLVQRTCEEVFDH